jgi:hypothetical protein
MEKNIDIARLVELVREMRDTHCSEYNEAMDIVSEIAFALSRRSERRLPKWTLKDGKPPEGLYLFVHSEDGDHGDPTYATAYVLGDSDTICHGDGGSWWKSFLEDIGPLWGPIVWGIGGEGESIWTLLGIS